MALIPHILFENMNNFRDEPALSTMDSSGNWNPVTWIEFGNQVSTISKSLLALGVQPDEKISIYGYNSKEWYGTYFGAQVIGSAAVGVYHTCSPKEVSWIVGNSNSKVVFVGKNPMDNNETEKMPSYRIREVLDELPDVEAVIMMPNVDALEHPKIMSWDTFIAKGDQVNDDDLGINPIAPYPITFDTIFMSSLPDTTAIGKLG